jgi:acyl-CoA synthetase (AMP-forming)/AMP-acid ligase II
MIFPRDRLGTVTDHRTQESWSGPEIGAAAGERARALTAAGIGPGDRVLLWQAGSGAFFADLLAVWAAGAAAAVLNPGLTPEELGRIAAHVGPKAALVAGNAATARGLLALPVFDFGADIVPAGVGDAAPRPGGLDDPALILFTSGTTGTPKGVVHSFRSLAARLALNAAFIGAADMKMALCTLPVHFGHGLIGNSLTPLLHGGDVVLMPGSDMRALGQLSAVIDRHTITFMSSVPAFWKLALKLAKPPT